MLLTMPLTQILGHFNLIDFSKHSAVNLFENSNIALVFLKISLIVPFIEELIFRFPLKFDYNIFPMSRLLKARKLSDADERSRIFQVQRSWVRNYPFIFYGFASLFALVHLINFPFSLNILIFAPILCLPQFILGVLASYIRLKFGFQFAVLLHGLHNFIFGLLAVLSL